MNGDIVVRIIIVFIGFITYLSMGYAVEEIFLDKYTNNPLWIPIVGFLWPIAALVFVAISCYKWTVNYVKSVKKYYKKKRRSGQ